MSFKNSNFIAFFQDIKYSEPNVTSLRDYKLRSNRKILLLSFWDNIKFLNLMKTYLR